MHRYIRAILVSVLWLQAILASPTLSPRGASRKTWNTPGHYYGGPWSMPGDDTRTKVCHVKPTGRGDDAPAIIEAFNKCGKDGKVIFDNITYHINSVMRIEGLSNVDIDVRGTLYWSPDIHYWLHNSIPIDFQNQSSAFILSGDQVHMHSSNSAGTFHGNGQVWYDFNKDFSNYPGRPHQITFSHLTHSVIENIRFLQSQMWTMTLMHSSNVLLQNIYVNSTDHTHRNPHGPLNTDGADTVNSHDITFAHWTVDCGDDHISTKANSRNILIEDVKLYHGSGIALGSIGQIEGEFSTIENIIAQNIFVKGARQGGYIKTWTGKRKGVPPNGGGGGTGYLKNVVFQDWTLSEVPLALVITQGINYNYQYGDLDTSHFHISDVKWTGIKGDQHQADVADLQCSKAAGGCHGVEISNVDMTIIGSKKKATKYICSNVMSPKGFKCSH